ncbi:MAG: SUMF1/EgtB/PvdO family nonheme iron enzyme [Opitutales bacterium]|nr:SUMF1/EgtB/PvdO family nonheme iron enzyme [Opitutales bacterium]
MRNFVSSSFLSRAKLGGVGGPIVFLLVAIVAIAAFYFASLSKGSREEYAEAQEIVPDSAEAEKKLSESRAAETQFNAIHEFKKDQITGEDIDIYEKAVTAYGDYLAYAGAAASYNPKLEQMRKHLHNLRADFLRKRTAELESRAEVFAAEKNYKEAERLFSEAANIEYRITKEYPLSSKKNHARANALDIRAKTMHAIPLQMQAKELEAEGEAALNAGHWPTANSRLSEALAIEKELWTNYRNVIVSNSVRIQRLSDLIATVNSAPEYERREQRKAEALAAEARGDWDAAAKAWESALAAHKTIIQNFPRSLYSGESVREEIATNLDNARARPEFQKLLEDHAQMSRDIRSGNSERVPQIAKQTLRRAERIRRDWINSTLVSDEFLNELRYMDLKAPSIPGVQSNLLKLLLPVPGAPANVHMMKTEVSQALYTFIMPFNPSALKNMEHPAESVDYNDATEFCRRLSLLLGRPVRLPTQEEFLAAAGTLDPKSISEQAWLIENSSGSVHPVGHRAANAAGFFDLYGNVAEWVSASARNAGERKEFEEFIAGGDCQTPSYSFPSDFFKKVARTEKSRTRGFRVVVEIEDTNVFQNR